MNAIAIYDEINMISKWDLKLFEKILEKYNLHCPNHIPKNMICHYLSLMLFLFLENTKETVNASLKNLRYDEAGVPRLGISYNSSYCTAAVCCAVANVEIGVDIQNDMDISFEEIKEYVSENEMKNLREGNEWKKQAIRLFTLKECFGKYYKFGLSYPIKNFSLWNSEDFFEEYGLKFSSYYFKNYIVSICSPQNLVFEFHIISYKELMDMANSL